MGGVMALSTRLSLPRSSSSRRGSNVAGRKHAKGRRISYSPSFHNFRLREKKMFGFLVGKEEETRRDGEGVMGHYGEALLHSARFPEHPRVVDERVERSNVAGRRNARRFDGFRIRLRRPRRRRRSVRDVSSKTR